MRVRDVLAQLKHADPDGLVTFYTQAEGDRVVGLAVDSMSLAGGNVVLSMDAIETVRRRTEIEADRFSFVKFQGLARPEGA